MCEERTFVCLYLLHTLHTLSIKELWPVLLKSLSLITSEGEILLYTTCTECSSIRCLNQLPISQNSDVLASWIWVKTTAIVPLYFVGRSQALMYVLCLQSDWFCTDLTESWYVCEKSLEMCICLWPEFDYPEVTLCGWQDIKIQLLLLLHKPFWLYGLGGLFEPGLKWIVCA